MKKKKKPEILLVDGDIMLYRFAHGDEYSIKWDEETTSQVSDLDAAIFKFDNFIEQCMEATGCIRNLLVFSVPTKQQFRFEIYPEYKANRAGLIRPELYYALKEHSFKNYETLMKPHLEADDVLGILMTKNPNRYILMSADKDLRQIHGAYYDPSLHKVRRVTKAQADRWFYIQALKGDTTDNIPGCPKIGDKKATKIIDDVIDKPFPIIWETIVNTYKSKGKDEEFALLMARLVRILRHGDYDYDKKEVILWTPTEN
jgi:DNA polymerase-1